MTSYSLFISGFDNSVTQTELEYIFKTTNWGKVDKINMINKDYYNIAFINLSSLTDNFIEVKETLEKGSMDYIYYNTTNDSYVNTIKVLKAHKKNYKKKR
jgi:hypothetical protein